MTRLPPYRFDESMVIDGLGAWTPSKSIAIVAIAAAVSAVVIVPWTGLVVLPVGGVHLLRRLRRTATARSDVRRVQDQLPEVATLLAVGLGGGLPLSQVCSTLEALTLDPFGSALRRVGQRQAHGHGLIDALDHELARLGGGADGLLPLLRSHTDDGAAIADALFDIAASARQTQRRLSEAEARRLPVRMLVPLIVCILPAFMALTVAPVIVESLRSFDL